MSVNGTLRDQIFTDPDFIRVIATDMQIGGLLF